MALRAEGFVHRTESVDDIEERSNKDRAPELSVGDNVQAQRLLLRKGLVHRPIFDPFKLNWADAALLRRRARFLETLRTEKRSDCLRAINVHFASPSQCSTILPFWIRNMSKVKRSYVLVLSLGSGVGHLKMKVTRSPSAMA